MVSDVNLHPYNKVAGDYFDDDDTVASESTNEGHGLADDAIVDFSDGDQDDGQTLVGSLVIYEPFINISVGICNRL